MIKITVKQLDESIEALRRLSQQPFSAATSFQIARILRLVEPEAQTYKQTHRELVLKYGEKRPDGTTAVTPENRNAFEDEWQPVLACELKLDIRPLSISLLDDVPIMPADLVVLDWLITEDDDA